jgi:DNA repair protein RadA/Sms
MLDARPAATEKRPSSATTQRLDELDELPPERIPTGDRAVDRVLGGGFGAGESVLLHGPRGSGKSRCAYRWASRAGGLVVALEMGPAMTRHTAASAGADLGRLWISGAEGWQQLARELGARVVVIDSVSRWPGPGSPVELVQQAAAWAESRGIVVLLISHENKRGRERGSAELGHDADTVARVENNRADGTARFRLLKRRLSPLASCRVELVPGALRKLRAAGRLPEPAEDPAGGEARGAEGEPPADAHG